MNLFSAADVDLDVRWEGCACRHEPDLRVNGVERAIASDPDTPLIHVLRDELKLKGAKLGCGLEQCGACAVLVDGEDSFSCATPRRRCSRARDHNGRGAGRHARRCAGAGRVRRGRGGAMRLLHAGARGRRHGAAAARSGAHAGGDDGRACTAPVPLRSHPACAARGGNRVRAVMSLGAHPLVRHWMRPERDRIVVRSGKVDLGQRISTALARIAAEEFALAPEDVEVAAVRTGDSAGRGDDLRQQFGGAVGPGGTPCLRPRPAMPH